MRPLSSASLIMLNAVLSAKKKIIIKISEIEIPKLDQSSLVCELMSCLSLILKQGCMDSNLAAMRAIHPSTMLFRYTIGVLPINCTGKRRMINASSMAE